MTCSATDFEIFFLWKMAEMPWVVGFYDNFLMPAIQFSVKEFISLQFRTELNICMIDNMNLDENITEKVQTKRQHSAPEYLERRKQERRKSESTLRARLRRARKSDPGSPKEVSYSSTMQVLCDVYFFNKTIMPVASCSLEVNKNA